MVNMVPIINNTMGIKSVKRIRVKDISPANKMHAETLKCLNCNISICNNQHYLQVDGTAQGLYICQVHTVILLCTFI